MTDKRDKNEKGSIHRER